jgi:preprotein translocase subunit SecA
MLNFISQWLDPQKATIDRYQQIVDVIDSWEPEFQALTDDQLRGKTAEFKKRLSEGESLEALLPEAFAAVREAGRRTLGQRHFGVQLMAGIAFHEGKVAEQKTGEGKTLSATLALYLNSLDGKGSHLVTVNDYLSQIGAGWMGPLYHLLGASVGVIIHDESFIYDPQYTGENRGDERLEHFRLVPRQQAYLADITYGTNNEFGFDYLRDNMAQRLSDQVQRGHHFAIVDEADSILIDEARTPLIISAPDTEPTDKYVRFAQLVRQLNPATDFVVDEKMRTAVLTEAGLHSLETMLQTPNLYEQDFDLIHHMEQALKARALFQLDKDYVVREGEIIIVDEHTGRLMFGRRYSDGLHQAIEAKENVKVQQESRTLATVSLQNYFRLYTKMAGMSGTAVTESEEFKKIYDMDVVVMPTNMPVRRRDNPDVIYKTMRAKYQAVAEEIKTIHAAGQPILLGTRSIEQNQIIGELLAQEGVPHHVLNAKNHEKEAFIIAEAGKKGAITVATNIAGRGVDIVLGGAQPEHRDYKTKTEYDQAKKAWQKDHDEVVSLGGLHILGTERHESRRIDNQLRGRAGRQGDPGSSRFFISLEDEIMRIFGGDQIKRVMDMMHIDENMPIEHPLINKAITQAQIKVEGFYFDQRKNLVEYDDVMNRQREIIYRRRGRLLQGMANVQVEEESELKQRLTDEFHSHFAKFVTARLPNGLDATELQNITTELAEIIPFDSSSLERISQQLAAKTTQPEITAFADQVFADIYKLRLDMLGAQVMRDVELYAFLSSLDEAWMDHLDEMTNLRDTIWLRGNKDQALAEYKKEAYSLFSKMIERIELEALKRVFRIQIQNTPTTMPTQIVEQGTDPAATLSQQETKTEKKKLKKMKKMEATTARTAKTKKKVKSYLA